MSSHHHKHAAVIRFLFFVCLFCSGAALEAQIEVPTPAAPSKSTEASVESELKLHNYQLKHAQAAAVLKMWQQLHGIVNGVTIDERTNSIVFLANEAAAREALETLALLDSETPSSIVQGPSPEVRVPARAESPYARLPFRKFTFKHAKVADVLKILRELAGSTKDKDDMEGFVVDERTNSVIWKVRDEWEARNWEEMCAALDAESPGSASKMQETPSPYRPTPASGSPRPTQTFTFSMGFERGESVESLKQRYRKLEQKAHQLADKLKNSKSPSESERSELQAAVRKSFEARQALHRAELADLARRMQSMQQSIDMRDKLADKVVERRVEDLLNPNLKWDARQMSEQLLIGPNQGLSNPAMLLPASPVPSNVSVPYVPGERPETVIRKRIQGRWIVQTHSDGNKDALPELAGQVEVEIEGNSMRYLVGKQEMTGPIFLADCKELESLRLREDGPFPIDFVYDPNGDPQTFRGIIACDGTTLSICMASDEGRANKDFRPSLFVPGTKVTLLKCHRAEPETANAVSVDASTEPNETKRPISEYLPPINALEMQQQLQGQWDVKIVSFSAGDPKELVIRDDLLLLPGNLLGKPILISMKLEWPNPNQLDEVDIIWEPNDQQAGYVINRLVGRIRCDGEKLQLCFVSGSGKVTRRPREMCGNDGIFYLECMRKRVSDSSKPLKDENAGANSLLGPTYLGQSISWWLDKYWKNATANPKSRDNEMEEMVAVAAIRQLRKLPECKTAIEAALARWFASVEHEVNESQRIRAAKCIVFAAGPMHQKVAVDYLFEIAKQVPIIPGEEDLGTWIDCWDDELDEALKGLVLNDELATQIADRLKTGNTAQRRFAVTILINRGASDQPETQAQTEANAWFRSHDKLFYPAFEAASQDTSEAIRMFALIALTGLDPHNSQLLLRLTNAFETDPSTQIRGIAIELLCSKEMAPALKSQGVELERQLIKTLDSDASLDVRYIALGALLFIDSDNELVHSTILQWAKSDDFEKVKYALKLTLRNHQAGDRPQSIDELVELLSDPEWGTAVEVAENNLETYHRWARQYAIAILGRYAAHAHRALPTLEAELARNNKDTLSFTTKALDSVRGYCPDRPIDQLQGQWEFVSVNRPNSTTAFFDFPLHDGGAYPAVGRELRTASDQQPASIINVSGTQLKLGDRVLAEISHQRQNLEVVMLLDPDGKKRHCNGRYEFKGGPSPEYKPNADPARELLILEVCELRDDSDATQATKQIYEFRPVKVETR